MFTAYALTSNEGPYRGRALVLRSSEPLTSPGHEKRTGWTQIAKVGEWHGHSDGRFELTAAHFADIIANFEAQETPPVFDYEHSTEFGTSSGKAIASGWIHKLEARGEQLWALVEWTEDAAKHIRAGEYRFTSAVLLYDVPHRETGEMLMCRLKSAALTNVPFMDGLHAVTLSERVLNSATAEKVDNMTVAASDKPVASAEEGASPEAAIAARLIEASGMSAQDLMSAIEANLDAVISALRTEEASAEEVIEEDPASMAAKDAQIKALSEKVAAFEKTARVALIAEIDTAITEKRIAASMRPSLVALAEKAPDVLRADLAKTRTAAPAYPAGRQASAIVNNAGSNQSGEVLRLSEKYRNAGLTDEAIISKYVASDLGRDGE